MRGIRLFRVGGISIEAHWSALITAALLTFLLGGSVIPALEPQASERERWLIAPLAAVGFIATLLAHEFAHSVTARRHGVDIERITLWLLGGVSEMRTEPDDPRQDLRIAVAGPAMSVAIGAGLVLLLVGLGVMGFGVGVPAAVIGWLAGTNFILAFFNLLPAMPLDGGRILRDVLWLRTGDRLNAARIAARGGQLLGLTLIALGVLEVVFLSTVSGIWLVLLGFFLRSAAASDLAMATARHQFAGVSIGDIMTPHPFAVTAGTSIEDFLHAGLPTWHRVFPIVDSDHHPVAVVSLLELARLSNVQYEAPIESVAHPLPGAARAAAGTPLTTVLSTAMLRPGLDLVAVVDDEGRLVGVVTATDLVTASARSSLGLPLSHLA